MKRKLAIVTGVSRGLGASLALELLKNDFIVYGISRHNNADLESWNSARDISYKYLEIDLKEDSRLEPALESIFSEVPDTGWEQIILINNAAVLDPICPLAESAPSELAVNMQVNLIAPLIMSAVFIRLTRGRSEDRRIINISSGAGRKPYQGWSAYCAAKAGMDRYSQVAGMELMESDPGCKIVSLAPGIIDTRMQEAIRSSQKKDFPLLDQFIEYFETGALMKPAAVAGRIVNNFVEQDFESGALLDIRDYM